MSKSLIQIYTDGACSGNPGPGGWGFLIIYPDQKKAEGSGAEAQTTNNRMELMAVIKALSHKNLSDDIKLYVDSQYVMNAFKDNWIGKWLKNNWKNSKGDPVANQDLWQTLIPLVEAKNIKWAWVKGHSGNEYNDYVDELARKAISALR